MHCSTICYPRLSDRFILIHALYFGFTYAVHSFMKIKIEDYHELRFRPCFFLLILNELYQYHVYFT